MRPLALPLAALLLVPLLLAGATAPARAVSVLAVDLAPGESAVALRTDPAVARCFQLTLDASLPGGRESAMAAVYLYDGTGRLRYAEVHAATVAVGLGPPAVHVGVTLPDGTQAVRRHAGYPAGPSGWRFLLDSQVCLPAPELQSWVFVVATSEGVLEARAAVAAKGGDLSLRQTVKGTSQGYAASDLEGVVVDTRYYVAPGATVAQKGVAASSGLVASFFSTDAAAALSVEGTGLARPQAHARTCATPSCVTLTGPSGGLLGVLGSAGAYTFRAQTVGAAGDPRPGASTYLLVADIRSPLAT